LRRGRDDAVLDGNGPCLPGLSVVHQAFPSVVVFPLCLTACHQREVHLQPVHTDLHAQFGCFEAGDPALHYLHDVFDDRLLVKCEAATQDVRRSTAAIGVAGALLADGVLRHLLDDKARTGATALVTA
ncbi:MAG: hypothetical protein ACK559_16725, partial [bacterium]